MGEEDYRTRWYTIPINALTPRDLLTLYNIPDLFSRTPPDANGMLLPAERPVQHCLIITRELCQWDSSMKNRRDLYPAP